MKKSASMGLWFAGVLAACASVPPPAPLPPVPTAPQRDWQRAEMTMFLHFGMNTFTDREWGDGRESPRQFNPSQLDARQWAQAAKAAGFRLLILTAKHHDGFCLWPSHYTEHSVKNSPWKNGQGDVVGDFVRACREQGLKVGLYLSPWDRHEATYGTPAYNDYFKKQLTELLTTYGPVDEMWFDGACGEGPNGKKQEYDWAGYYAVIRRLAPRAVIAVSGPDVRWVGNESGVARAGESSVQPANDKHRAVGIRAETVWYPAECDVSIRPGWFYHASEDGRVKPLDQLLDIYFKSVGRNSVLLLNVPPDRRGRIADADLARLRELRAALDGMARSGAGPVRATSDAVRGGAAAPDFAAARAVDGRTDTYWATDDGVRQATLTVAFPQPRAVNVVNVQEAIEVGERVSAYHVDAQTAGGEWTTIARGTVIGSRNLLRIPAVKAARLRLVIDDARAAPCIAEFGAGFLAGGGGEWGGGSLAASKPAEASNVHPGGTQYGADKAVDNDPDTRWATADEVRSCWLDVDLLSVQTLGRVSIAELTPRIREFLVLVREKEGDPWKTAYVGTDAGAKFQAEFPAVRARWVRLDIRDASAPPSLWEFGVYPPAP